jgi:hypothetical protein
MSSLSVASPILLLLTFPSLFLKPQRVFMAVTEILFALYGLPKSLPLNTYFVLWST